MRQHVPGIGIQGLLVEIFKERVHHFFCATPHILKKLLTHVHGHLHSQY